MRCLPVLEAGVGALGSRGGRVLAAGAGWAWVRDDGRPVHITGEDGPRGPLTCVVYRVPVIAPGARLSLDPSAARRWHTPPPPPPADRDLMATACAAVRAHMWNDPRALDLGRVPLARLIPDLVGRGPGLTPAGDDVLLGYLLARRALAPEAASRAEGAQVLRAARRGTGGPALALLRMAVHGEAPEPAAAMRDALIGARGPDIAPAVRRLQGLGRTTGRAILTGLVAGITAEAA